MELMVSLTPACGKHELLLVINLGSATYSEAIGLAIDIVTTFLEAVFHLLHAMPSIFEERDDAGRAQERGRRSHSFLIPLADQPELQSQYHPHGIQQPHYSLKGCDIAPSFAVPTNSNRTALLKERGLLYVSQIAVRHPESPLEPLFRALWIEKPSFNIKSVNVLLAFTIDVEVVGQTSLLSGVEEHNAVVSVPGAPDQAADYGNESKKTATTQKIKDSTGHRRIVSYRPGDLNIFVRNVYDDYVEDSDTDGHTSTMGSLSLGPDTKTIGQTVPSKLAIKKEGNVVPSKKSWNQVLLACVEAGSSMITEWERTHQPDIKRLITRLKISMSMTKDQGGTSTLTSDRDEGSLVITKATGKKIASRRSLLEVGCAGPARAAGKDPEEA
ncbi:geranylgeranyl pyrophosphate synthetase [Penicillium argentinense]|uniref:Geranylgeranyl pyrophosphate synthetase n=1 Tax=Penicillium argentinense TaxID=1131581 RepID=A0A9W9K1V2_9EURO|nr:geranylgeranyl pyrophosphate synthetase [Penicillium argentinense]KAJ5089968.1 geranylgeranyl pyrophosphate synthetase [Penicillium argentinense]